MRREERKDRISLTLLVNAVVVSVTLATLLLVGAVLGLLLHFGMLTGPSTLEVILIFAAASLVVSAIITFFVSRIPLAPVNKLINYINRLAGGDYKVRMELGSLWEKHPSVVELKNSLNRLASELESTEMLRSDFINNFSHEFKTPIVSITGFARLLRHAELSPEQRAEYLAIIEEESMRLSKMATNVLDVTKVENQTILTKISSFNLSEQLRSCILLLVEKWERKELDFVLVFGEHDIEADAELLKQVWINLLDNAIKFSPAKGRVQLSIHDGGDTLTVSVTNSGVAISPESQKHIFNKFYQADRSHSSEGYGIGLAIVKRVVELHSGSIAIESAGGLNTFSVTLPKKQKV